MKNKQYYIDKIKLRYPDIKLICNDPETILKKRLIYLDRVCDIHGVVSTPVESLLEGRNCKYCTGGSRTPLPLFIDQLNSKFNSTFCDATYKEPNYHLNKYNLCKENGIDLIHIFEFEDLDEWLVKLGS